MARLLNSEADAQRVMFSYYRGKEDQEAGRDFPERNRDYPKGIKGNFKYRAYYAAGYHGDDVDPDVYEH